MKLRIHYRDSESQVTERVISDVVLEPPKMLNAFCHLRGGNRSFVLNRIEHAVDLETGKTIPDIWVFFGLPSQQPVTPEMPIFPEVSQELTLDEARNLRKADKYALFSSFKIDAIKELYRNNLWELFQDRCFRCGSTHMIELDHHIPQSLGGRLVAGNLVLLCSQCNLYKKDKHPDDFYTPQQLSQLKEIFQAQLKLFNFKFDWSRWNHNPKEYLLSLGIPEIDIQQALTPGEGNRVRS
jgi:5-methylcytosine-specific restriction endonuclease McrA